MNDRYKSTGNPSQPYSESSSSQNQPTHFDDLPDYNDLLKSGPNYGQTGYSSPPYPPQHFDPTKQPDYPPGMAYGGPPKSDYPSGMGYGGPPKPDPQLIGFVPPVLPTVHMPPSDNNNLCDPENLTGQQFGFNDASIRRNFIRKVYGILSVQLLVTLAFITFFVFNKPGPASEVIVWIAMGVSLITVIMLACVESVRRTYPTNLIVLGIFTVAESYMVGVFGGMYSPEEVMIAVIVTTVVVLGLTIFAFQTKWDFTACGGILFVALILFIFFGIGAAFFPGKAVTLVYSSLGAFLFSIYIVFDTQMMMGGSHRFSISPEEYVFAALALYLDIINLFIHILKIIGEAKK